MVVLSFSGIIVLRLAPQVVFRRKKIKRRDNIRGSIRLIQIDKKLRGGAYVKMDELAFEFGVSRRTIERAFEHLRDEMNAPLAYDQTRNMYHYTDPTFSIPNVILTEGELFTVSALAQLMEQYRNTPLEQSFKNIMAKIVSFLPDSIVVDSAFLNNDVCFISDPLPKIDEHIFNAIFKAIRSRTVVSFEYKSSRSRTYKKKFFDAYRVLCQKGSWYAIGLDRSAEEIRVYALARIKDIVFENKQFAIPKEFDIENHIDLDFGIWNNPEQAVEYEILFSPQTVNYVLEREWHKDQQIERKEDGSALLRFKSNQRQMIFSWLMGFGNNATVINPPELCEQIKAECEAMAKKYGGE